MEMESREHFYLYYQMLNDENRTLIALKALDLVKPTAAFYEMKEVYSTDYLPNGSELELMLLEQTDSIIQELFDETMELFRQQNK